MCPTNVDNSQAAPWQATLILGDILLQHGRKMEQSKFVFFTTCLLFFKSTSRIVWPNGKRRRKLCQFESISRTIITTTTTFSTHKQQKNQIYYEFWFSFLMGSTIASNSNRSSYFSHDIMLYYYYYLFLFFHSPTFVSSQWKELLWCVKKPDPKSSTGR